MAVILVPKFSKAYIEKFIERKKKALSDAVLSRMQFIGEHFVKNARENANFKDRTGNLRSSIGYVILYNGKQLFYSFQEFPRKDGKKKRPKGEKSGVKEAKKMTAKIKQEFPSGYVLIGVAGMEYAAAVESLGYDVITASSIEAENSLKAAIKIIQEKVAQAK